MSHFAYVRCKDVESYTACNFYGHVAFLSLGEERQGKQEHWPWKGKWKCFGSCCSVSVEPRVIFMMHFVLGRCEI